MPRVIFASLLLSATPALAAESAAALMDKVFSRSSWDDMQGDITLTMTNKRGDQKEREIELWSKKNADGESSMLMRFMAPADVRGTGFLLIEHRDGDDDRRLFLPALRRVQRISASGSGGNFMSSDFTYYDIGRPKVRDWTFTFVDGKTIDGVACKGVEGVAASQKVKDDTGYSKVVWYIDPARLVSLGADYYDKDGAKLKVMHVEKVEEISGTPFATRMKVEDVTTGHQSEMAFKNLETDKGLSDRLFTERNLRKWTR